MTSVIVFQPEEREQEEMLVFLTLLQRVFTRVLLVLNAGSLERSLMDQDCLLLSPIPEESAGIFLFFLLRTTESSSCICFILRSFLLIN